MYIKQWTVAYKRIFVQTLTIAENASDHYSRSIVIPSTVASIFNCKIITVEYKLNVKVVTNALFSPSACVDLPIIIAGNGYSTNLQQLSPLIQLTDTYCSSSWNTIPSFDERKDLFKCQIVLMFAAFFSTTKLWRMYAYIEHVTRSTTMRNEDISCHIAIISNIRLSKLKWNCRNVCIKRNSFQKRFVNFYSINKQSSLTKIESLHIFKER